MRNCNTF